MARKKDLFKTPTGMHDILPEEQIYWQYFYRIAEGLVSFYNFYKIDTPILEQTELFEKGTGLGSDIVQKEMYSLRTRGGDKLTLRPDGTPSIIRAYLQHGMHKRTLPLKVYYYGPMFRHEKPQRGRFRQFYQFGLETIGELDHSRDVEIIEIFYKILRKLGLKELIVEINSIGCNICRNKYIKALKAHYRYRLKQVCVDCRKRYANKPLRLLDCEEEKCQRVKTEAPHMVDYLCQDCKQHFKRVLDLLDYINVPYLLNPYLVRGLDYYTRTVFEIFEVDASTELEIKENVTRNKRLAIVSGGRYDNLVEVLGGEYTPAVGAALGIERMLNILKNTKKKSLILKSNPRIFLIQLGDRAKKKAFYVFNEFYKAGIPLREAFGRESISSQLKLAEKFKVDFSIIIGQKEALGDMVMIRDMKTGSQETILQEELINEMRKRLKKVR